MMRKEQNLESGTPENKLRFWHMPNPLQTTNRSA